MNDSGESPRQVNPDMTDPYIALAYRVVMANVEREEEEEKEAA